jgi:cation:H+ antiporter
MLVVITDILDTVTALLERIPAIGLIAVGVPLMLYGADRLVDGSVTIARRLGVSTLLIGLTIVAAGTSAPELAVNVVAALSNNSDLSFGNVIGSNIANIGLVVGIGALIIPMRVHSRVIRSEIPWLVVISLITIVMAFIPFAESVTTGSVVDARYGYGRIDGMLLVAMLLWLSWLWYRHIRGAALGHEKWRVPDESSGTSLPDSQSSADKSLDPITREVEEAAKDVKDRPLSTAAMLFVAGLILLLVGGKLTESGAVSLAMHFDVSNAIVGMTIVAVATSLPELITVIVACRKGHADLAVGNVVGSNLFNLLLVLGATALIADVPLPPATGWQDLVFMFVMTIGLWWMATGKNQRIARLEGALLLSAYIAYLTWGVLREVG